MLLHVFLKRHYKNVEVVFIRHTEEAKEVQEDDFFRSVETGGTMISPALEEVNKIIMDRYSPSDWNVYIAQSSDGDNMPDDNRKCIEVIENELIPKIQYFAYVEVHRSHHTSIVDSNLWDAYNTLKSDTFALRKVNDVSMIFPVFHDLFSERK